MKLYTNGPGLLTKMAPCSNMVKAFKNFLQNQWPFAMKIDMLHLGLGPIIICSNYNFGSTLTNYTPGSYFEKR